MTIDIPPSLPVIHGPSPSVQAAAEEANGKKVIGQATMQPDGTIIMQLRLEDPTSGAVGHSYPSFAPGSPRYNEILEHLGPFKPGETKPVMNDWR
jgi:hypothetical protein